MQLTTKSLAILLILILECFIAINTSITKNKLHTFKLKRSKTKKGDYDQYSQASYPLNNSVQDRNFYQRSPNYNPLKETFGARSGNTQYQSQPYQTQQNSQDTNYQNTSQSSGLSKLGNFALGFSKNLSNIPSCTIDFFSSPEPQMKNPMNKILTDSKDLINQIDYIVFECSRYFNSYDGFRSTYINHPLWWLINSAEDPNNRYEQIARNIREFDSDRTRLLAVQQFTSYVLNNAYYSCNDPSRFSAVQVDFDKLQTSISQFQDKDVDSLVKDEQDQENIFSSFKNRVTKWIDEVKASVNQNVFGRLLIYLSCLYSSIKLPDEESFLDKIDNQIQSLLGNPLDFLINLMGNTVGYFVFIAYRAVKSIYAIWKLGYDFYEAYNEVDETKKWTMYGEATLALLDTILYVLFDFKLSKLQDRLTSGKWESKTEIKNEGWFTWLFDWELSLSWSRRRRLIRKFRKVLKDEFKKNKEKIKSNNKKVKKTLLSS